jgi:large subunit ribosomal protein L4
LTYKAQDNEIIIVEDFNFEAPKTKEFVNFAKNLQIADKKALYVLANENKNVYLSARNLPTANVMIASEVNTYALLNNKAIVLTESSLDVINKF